MSTIPVKVQLGAKTFPIDINLSEADTGEVFKLQVYSVTGVPPDRQKLLTKGGLIKDDTQMSSLNLKPNQVIRLIGTPESVLSSKKPVSPPTEKTKFIEDLSKAELAKLNSVEYPPSGIKNLGNTCYLNSSLQALRTVPELRNALQESRNSPLAAGLRNTLNSLDSSNEPYYPLSFLSTLRSIYPQFAELDGGNKGVFKQQDAEEVFSLILTNLKNSLPDNAIENLFGIQLKCVTRPKNATDNSTEESVSYETSFKLDCHITIQTNFLQDGLKKSLIDEIEKHSEATGGNEDYIIEKRITKLPKYLVVHFVRFFWKRETQKKSKIMRKVAFPSILDATQYCDDELKSTVIPTREKILAFEKDHPKATPEEKKAFGEELSTDKQFANSPLYELSAVITHQGASADSGHYQCFAKNKSKWWRFDDDKVYPVTEEKIETLSGGGESDSALILLYKRHDYQE